MKKRYKEFKRFVKESLTVEVKPPMPKFTMDDVLAVGHQLGLEFVPLKQLIEDKNRKPNQVCPKQLLAGLLIETEHADITNLDLVLTAKIALAHLRESESYYKLLEEMEKKFPNPRPDLVFHFEKDKK